MKIQVLNESCSGPNKHCISDAHEGRYVHVIAMSDIHEEPALVMPSWHFFTVREGVEAVRIAWETAPMITCDEDLFAARRMKIAHKLPVGWIDPSRR